MVSIKRHCYGGISKFIHISYQPSTRKGRKKKEKKEKEREKKKDSLDVIFLFFKFLIYFLVSNATLTKELQEILILGNTFCIFNGEI